MPGVTSASLARTGVRRRATLLIGVEPGTGRRSHLGVGLRPTRVGTSRVMTRLLERLEHVLEHTPLRATAPRHRRESLRRVTAARLIVPVAPRPAAHAGPASDPAPGFLDCRGEWHAWEDAS